MNVRLGAYCSDRFRHAYADARPWIDAKYNQDALLRGDLTGDGWSHLAVTSVVWLVVPMVVAVVNVLRSEVK